MNVSSANLCLATADDAFGPVVEGCRDDFDFTLTFEQSFFTLIPASLLLLVTPFRVWKLRKLPNVVRGTAARYVKLVAVALLSIFQLTSTILWVTMTGPSASRSVSIASSGLSSVATFVALALSYMEHVKSKKPSATFTTYLFFSLILDLATLRTTWLLSLPIPIKAVGTLCFCWKAAVLSLEVKEKAHWTVDDGCRQSPESTSGIFNQGLFWWLNSLLASGFRQLLRPDDLFILDDDMSASMLNEKFWTAWNRAHRDDKHKLLNACVVTLKWPILAAVPPRLILVGFTICQPLLLERFLQYLRDMNESANISYGLIAAYGLVYVGMAVSSGFYSHRAFRMATMLRGTLITAIFRKTIEISITTADNSASVTLMSTDVDTIVRAMRQVHDLWADMIQVAVATWLLSRLIGPAAVAPVVVCLLSLSITMYASPKAQGSQAAWFTKVQRRVGITSQMLGHMKSIKMSGLAPKLAATITQMRVDEIAAAKPFRMIMVSTAALAQIPVLLSPVAAFAAFVAVAARAGETFEATRLFSSLSLIILLAAPLFGTFETILNLNASLASFNRIQKYLSLKTKDKHKGKIQDVARSSENASPSSYISPQSTSSPTADGQIELGSIPGSTRQDKQLNTNNTCVRLQGASFSWAADSPVAINNVSTVVYKGEMLIIMGPVASGKSTLLKGILNEVPIVSGEVTVASGPKAWCDQTPWLKNDSIRDNIIGYAHFDPDLYKEVIWACDLKKDLAHLPGGDRTVIGSKGVSLSGGQKQRVALARAVYSRPHIALFDDVLSGLDGHTASVICSRLFSTNEGLLKKWGTTIILATQSILPLTMADELLVLGSDGSVAEAGSFGEVMSQNGYVKSIYRMRKDNPNVNSETGSQDDEEVEQLVGKNAPKDDITDKRRQIGDNTVYRFYFSSLGPAFTAILVVMEFSNAFLQTFPTVWLKWWSDASEAEGNQSIGVYLGVYMALQFAALLTFFLLTWFVIVKIVAKSGLELHGRLLQTVVRAPLALFTTDDTGSLTTRFSQDIGEVDRNLPLGMLVTIQSFLTCIGQAILIASATWYLAISYPALIGVFFFLQKAYLRTSRQLRFLDLEEKAPVYTQFIETLAGLSTIRAFGWGQAAIQQNYELVDRAQRPFYLLLMVQRWLTLVLDFIIAALALLVVGLAVKLRDSISVGLTGVSLVQLITFAETMRMLILWWTSLETSIGAVARIKQFSEHTGDENLVGEERETPLHWPAQGAIDMRGISASYGPKHETLALDNISLSIKAGEKIGIVGRTGSGKSSLLLSLVRMLDLSSGTIIIDSLDLSTVSREETRARLIVITQDQFLLPGSVRQNVDPYESASTDQIWVTLSKVGLRESIEAKGGLDVDLEEETLSHGQRQLFFLARAILRKEHGNIVLFDEATSSVDQQTGMRVQELIRKEFAAHTVISIAHRLETIADFDRVVVLEKGAVVEQGAPSDLLRKLGPFRVLWDASHGD
ncbi:hypothetical protein JX266_001926 [Neoarthrinium moseri]|nr:hypothetical protein JX266_001926 [Neoarthrinium moseri]